MPTCRQKQGVLTENLWPKLFSEAPRCAPLRLFFVRASGMPSCNLFKTQDDGIVGPVGIALPGKDLRLTPTRKTVTKQLLKTPNRARDCNLPVPGQDVTMMARLGISFEHSSRAVGQVRDLAFASSLPSLSSRDS